MRYADGASYEGGFKAGLRDGQGAWRAANGDEYVGEWASGLMHGRGCFTRRDDRSASILGGAGTGGGPIEGVYDGQWVAGKLTGRGTVRYNSIPPASYDGEWQQGLWHGRGRYVHSNGTTYEGMFRAHKRHGFGVSSGHDGQLWFRGWWRNNHPYFGNPYFFIKRRLARLLRESAAARWLYFLCIYLLHLCAVILAMGSSSVLVLAILFAPSSAG